MRGFEYTLLCAVTLQPLGFDRLDPARVRLGQCRNVFGERAGRSFLHRRAHRLWQSGRVEHTAVAPHGDVRLARLRFGREEEVGEDLRTRLGSGLIYRLQPLTDAEKAAAVATLARERALKLSTEVINYLLRHASRDMRTLAMLVIALDQYTLEQKRPVTLPLLRELLALEHTE